MAAALMYNYQGSPQGQQHFGPPSPPVEEKKCSLPSISNLLGLADAGSPTNEYSSDLRRRSPQPDAFSRSRREIHYDVSQSRPTSRHARALDLSRGMPPSPPMSTAASFDGHSPTSRTNSKFSSFSSAPHHYQESTPPFEGEHHSYQQSVPQQLAPPQGASASYTRQPYHAAPYEGHPPAAPSYYASEHTTRRPGSEASSYQRPLPQNFPPPPPPPVSMQPVPAQPVASAWQHQHHHYLSPSYGGYPQNQDRYICQTCNKAFSRPSSLRIHSHSHTGEKPFKCPHVGCGKAFSVRSNMKRHERGCHSFDVSAAAGILS